MPKMTKTQKKRALQSLIDKSFRLLGQGVLSTNDFEKVHMIAKKGMRKIN